MTSDILENTSPCSRHYIRTSNSALLIIIFKKDNTTQTHVHYYHHHHHYHGQDHRQALHRPRTVRGSWSPSPKSHFAPINYETSTLLSCSTISRSLLLPDSLTILIVARRQSHVIEGSVDHEDFTGSKGTLNAGDLQFMTAGRGIVHAEMPAAGPDGEAQVVEGIQLWVDLPNHLKDCEPRYRDLKAEEIPEAHSENKDLIFKVISGQAMGVDSVKDLAYTPVWYLDYFTESDYNGTGEPDHACRLQLSALC